MVIASARAGLDPARGRRDHGRQRTASAGTIGGGQLEFHCIDIARAMLAEGESEKHLDIPLGPQMGQCCGGGCRFSLKRADAAADLAMLEAHEKAEAASRERRC
jgi:xanthine dehydrogenase accessory factor